MIKKLTISLFIMVSAHVINAQNNSSVEKLLNDYMNIVRKEVYSPSPEKELYNEENAESLLKLLGAYYNDSLTKVRLKAYYLTYKSVFKSTDLELRNKAVYNLVQGLKDTDSGNTGSTANWLTNFKSQDFNKVSKDSLKSILRSSNAHLDQIIKLVAFVRLDNEINYLKNNLSNGVYNSNKTIWATHLALARMGVQEEIDFCIDMVKKQPVNDDIIYELIPDLIYTRQKQAFDYIISILQSDAKNCFSANPENPQKILCGYRVMEFLAPVIKDFPLEVDSTGDLVVDDYEKALKITRKWFNEHVNDYVITEDTY